VRLHDGDTDGTIVDIVYCTTDADDLCDDQRLYYLNDANMNVTALVNTSGTVVERYVYDPYGKVTVLDGTTGGQTDWAADSDGVSDVDNRTLYAGYHFDSETGLFHIRWRYYHPTLGRWLTRDPLNRDIPGGDYHNGMNLYEYIGTNPIRKWDTTGLRSQSVIKKAKIKRNDKGEWIDFAYNYKYTCDLKKLKIDVEGAWIVSWTLWRCGAPDLKETRWWLLTPINFRARLVANPSKDTIANCPKGQRGHILKRQWTVRWMEDVIIGISIRLASLNRTFSYEHKRKTVTITVKCCCDKKNESTSARHNDFGKNLFMVDDFGRQKTCFGTSTKHIVVM